MPVGGTPSHAARERRQPGHANLRIADAGARRAHPDAERSVAFGRVAARDHGVPRRRVGRVAMVRVGPLVPQPINRHGAGRTRAGRRVGQRDVELGGRLLDVTAEVRIGRDLVAAPSRIPPVSRQEMRIAVLGRDVEPAYRVTTALAPAAAGDADASKTKPVRPQPAMRPESSASISLGKRRDEVVIERCMVVLDDRIRVRRRAARHGGERAARRSAPATLRRAMAEGSGPAASAASSVSSARTG